MKGGEDLQESAAGRLQTMGLCVEELTSIYGRVLCQMSYTGAPCLKLVVKLFLLSSPVSFRSF